MGGGLISGVNSSKGSTLSSGNTYVEVAEGNISRYLVGGNQTNWYGTSVIGELDENGVHEINGHRYSEGSSTAVLSGGGNKQTLHVIGCLLYTSRCV